MVRKPIQLANLGMLKTSLVNLMGYSVAPIARCLDVVIVGGTLHLCGRLNRHVEARALYARTDVRGARTDARALRTRINMAVVFLKRAESRRYGGLWSELENNLSRGQDQYPADLTSAYNLLLNYKAAPVQRPPRRENNKEAEVSGMSFLQSSGPLAGTDGVTHSTVKCYGCNIYDLILLFGLPQ
jgi:hypothetical protein